MKTKHAVSFKAMSKDYAGLCRVFPPRPIHDDVSYRNTVEIADAFAGFEDRMTRDQNDYFDLLCDLIEQYETESSGPPGFHAVALLSRAFSENPLRLVR